MKFIWANTASDFNDRLYKAEEWSGRKIRNFVAYIVPFLSGYSNFAVYWEANRDHVERQILTPGVVGKTWDDVC